MNVFIGLKSNKPLSDSKLKLYLDLFPVRMQADILRCKSPVGRTARLLGKLALLESIKQFRLSAELLNCYCVTKTGRPFFKTAEEFSFSISHSGNMAVCAASNECVIGADIEEIRSIKPEILSRKLSLDGRDLILGSKDPNEMFFNYWTRLESYTKAKGENLAANIRKSNVWVQPIHERSRTWYFRRVFAGSNYTCHICTDKKVEKLRKICLSF